jgi:hypothetical protein
VGAGRHWTAGGAIGRLLLVAVLAVGMLAMHTVGHPAEGSAAAASSSSGRHAQAVDDAEPAAHTTAAELGTELGTDMDMDTAALCLAVLSSWALAALLHAALARRAGRRPARVVRIVPAVLRPNPPPRRPDLNELSILRT